MVTGFKFMDTNKIKIYLISTEPSGDVIGANLINSFKRINQEKYKFNFYGVGGGKMIKAGLKKSLFPIEQLSIFGFFEVVPKLFKIFNLLSITIKDIDKIKPDFLITIDSPDFNFRVLKRMFKKSYQVKKIHYVAPTVWVWRKNRAKILSKYADQLLTILPFESKYFIKHNLKTKFVGHPIFDIKIKRPKQIDKINKKYNINGNPIILSFLPGSRHSEIIRTIPVFIRVMEDLKKKFKKNVHVLLCLLPQLRKHINKYNLNFPYSIIDEDDKYYAFQKSDAAVCASGTAALELSYFKVPTIVIYKVNSLTYLSAKLFIKVKYANLINILRNKEIIPEFIQFKCKPKLIVSRLIMLFKNKNYRNKQLLEAKKTIPLLKANKKLPSINAANEILKMDKF